MLIWLCNYFFFTIFLMFFPHIFAYVSRGNNIALPKDLVDGDVVTCDLVQIYIHMCGSSCFSLHIFIVIGYCCLKKSMVNLFFDFVCIIYFFPLISFDHDAIMFLIIEIFLD